VSSGIFALVGKGPGKRRLGQTTPGSVLAGGKRRLAPFWQNGEMLCDLASLLRILPFLPEPCKRSVAPELALWRGLRDWPLASNLITCRLIMIHIMPIIRAGM